MFIYPFLADAIGFEEEFNVMQQHTLNVSYYCVYAIVLLILAALIINHIKLKTLFTNSLVPFFVLFALHPAWLLRILKLEQPSTLEISSYVFLGLAVLWFVIFLIIMKKPLKAQATSEGL